MAARFDNSRKHSCQQQCRVKEKQFLHSFCNMYAAMHSVIILLRALVIRREVPDAANSAGAGPTRKEL
eukprot:1286362-Amphidinium_carterae.1